MVRSGVTYAYVKDHLGSIRLVVNATSGLVQQRLDYNVWGVVIVNTAPGSQPFGFMGGVIDLDTGFTHFGFRDYDASSGLWTAMDPIRLRVGDGVPPGSLLQNPLGERSSARRGESGSSYQYAMNSPLLFVDPSGLAPKDKLFGLPKKFWNWYHRKIKGKGVDDLDKEAAEALHGEWKEAGCPGPDGKGPKKTDLPSGVDDFFDFFLPPFMLNPCALDPWSCGIKNANQQA
jgi:RHS repeat-associated protein